MTENAGSIIVSFDLDLSAVPAQVVGYKHQQHENFRRYLHPGWGSWFKRADGNLAEYAGVLAALAAVAVFALTPGMRMPGFWPFLWLGLVVGAMVWLLLRYWTRRNYDTYLNAFAESVTNHEIEFAKSLKLEIGPAGLTSTTATDKVFLNWRRYHCAVVEPEHLVLVFEGSVFALPNKALPMAPLELANQINKWVESAASADGPAFSRSGSGFVVPE